MKKILIVDDSPTDRELASHILMTAGYKVILATNGEEGVATAEKEMPDLILMDVIMPGEFNGFQATRTLTSRPATKDIPIIVLSTKQQKTDKVWAERQGAKHYIVKPAEKESLLEIVKKLIGV